MSDTLPEIDDMMQAGMPLPVAFQFWSRMMSDPDRSTAFWWAALREWRRASRSLH